MDKKPHLQKNCPVCSLDFIARRKEQVCCSNHCRKSNYGKHPERSCIGCGTFFLYSRSRRSENYCSRECFVLSRGKLQRLQSSKIGEKLCSSCNQVKPFFDFSPKRKREDGIMGAGDYTNRCKACKNKDHKELMQDKQSAYYKKRHALNPEHKILSRCKSRAAKLGLPFDLCLDDLIIPDVCPVLGIPLNVGENIFHDGSPSIDRKIPSLGYIKSNIEIISQRANRIKNDASLVELESIVKWMKK